MLISEILDFLSDIKENNNREWFATHKERYLAAKKEFDSVVATLLDVMSLWDETIVGLRPADCIFRFYRDVRFSADKSPYKRHFGAYICKDGGRKSRYSGYYLHLEPNNVQLIGGLWAPESRVLKKVRRSIVDNFDELREIMSAPLFKQYFGDMISYEKTKRLPIGFDKTAEGAEYLTFKHFLIESKIKDSEVDKIDFVSYVNEHFKAMLAFNNFLNYSIDE